LIRLVQSDLDVEPFAHATQVIDDDIGIAMFGKIGRENHREVAIEYRLLNFPQFAAQFGQGRRNRRQYTDAIRRGECNHIAFMHRSPPWVCTVIA